MSITQLEQNMIDKARAAQEHAEEFYRQHKAGKTDAEDYEAYQSQYHALSTLVAFAHEKDSGLSVEAIQQLRDIEDAEAAAFREYGPAGDAARDTTSDGPLTRLMQLCRP
ncbi:hypothetical protein [Pseudomonas sp.]|uniref:hypothetical protein n=1 Tax=Pseudomonas sp. TaxID=306 RepID=UPI00290CE3CB|nr:hypothetical protein [Pseudomonas sp.]MDU4254548.1 hypothetical protein [Pseudomonas sp.]